MLSEASIQRRRTVRGLKQFVARRMASIKAVKAARHQAMLRRGLYKKFTDEIIPLARYCWLHYPKGYHVEPVLGNQGFDARILNEQKKFVEWVEITVPQDGKADANDYKLVVGRGYGKMQNCGPCGDLHKLAHIVGKTCAAKAQKDYSDASLVIYLKFVPLTNNKAQCMKIVHEIVAEIQRHPFKAKNVFVLASHYDELIDVRQAPQQVRYSALARASDLAGCLSGGPADLSANRTHLKGYGR
jgi:hypothetical protein